MFVMKQPLDDHIVGASAAQSSVGWGYLVRFVLLFLMTVALIHNARGEYGRKAIHEMNAMFDSVWCPLPTWLHIVLVIAAWAQCYRVGKDFVKTWKRDGMMG